MPRGKYLRSTNGRALSQFSPDYKQQAEKQWNARLKRLHLTMNAAYNPNWLSYGVHPYSADLDAMHAWRDPECGYHSTKGITDPFVRSVAELVDSYGYTSAEIATQLGVSEDTLNERIERWIERKNHTEANLNRFNEKDR